MKGLQPNGQTSLGKVVWARFPQFVLAFLSASLLSTWWQATSGKSFGTDFTNNLNALRTWLFTLTFLSIGLNTRFRDMRDVTGKAVAVFTCTVLANVIGWLPSGDSVVLAPGFVRPFRHVPLLDSAG
ncbi:putative sulfate exporter family transporter [Alicyclobacillus acidocaldarius]|uniref:putative sulfate exporter family transporter n=1 Tax=Alicyclobacillus acidocaldarius TaxID=405212 RepID=UPI0035BE2B55